MAGPAGPKGERVSVSQHFYGGLLFLNNHFNAIVLDINVFGVFITRVKREKVEYQDQLGQKASL